MPGHGAAPALDQLGRPGEPQTPLLAHGQPPLADAGEQPGVVHGREVGPLRRARLVHLVGPRQPVGDDTLGEQAYLGSGNLWRGGSGKRQRWCVQTCIEGE